MYSICRAVSFDVLVTSLPQSLDNKDSANIRLVLAHVFLKNVSRTTFLLRTLFRSIKD